LSKKPRPLPRLNIHAGFWHRRLPSKSRSKGSLSLAWPKGQSLSKADVKRLRCMGCKHPMQRFFMSGMW